MRKTKMFLAGLFALLLAGALVWTGCEQPAGPPLARPETAATPRADPGGGKVGAGTRVRLSTATKGADIYFTINGDTPDNTGTRYTDAIIIKEALTLKAVAVREGIENSAVLEAAYELDPDTVAAPEADPPAGDLDFGAAVALSSATEGAEIYYTTDGSAPDSGGTKYTDTERIIINRPLTLKAIAVKEGMKNSAVLEAAYGIAEEQGQAAKPVANPPAGEVDSGTALTLSTATEGAEIRYTTDGSAPGANGIKYTEPITIDRPLTIKAVALKEGIDPSETLEAAYTVAALGTVARPSADPPAGELSYGAVVTLSTTTAGAEIYYTINGEAPDRTKAKYTGPVGISGTLTLKAIAVKAGLADSTVLEAAYTVKVETPAASPAGGEVPAGTKVTLFTPVPGAEIYYTLNGEAPDKTKTKYTGPVTVSGTLTLKAIALKAGLADSAVLEAEYIVRAEAPAASPAGGEVAAGTKVTLSTATAEAEIYYTADGTVPDRTKTRYTGPITIDRPVTIKAIAAKAGMTDSVVLEAAYTVAAADTVAKPSANPPAGETTAGTTVTLSTTTAGASIYYTTDGTTPDKSKRRYTGPVSVNSTLTLKAIAVKAGMADSAVLEAAYTVRAVPGVETPTAYPPSGELAAGAPVTLSTGTAGADIYYTTNGTVPAAGTGTKYAGPLTITGTPNSTVTVRAIAVKAGMTDSAELTAVYTIAVLGRVVQPAADPPDGEVEAGTRVTLSTATAGASIYYTTDGAEPDRSKRRYSGPIGISAPLTLKAIAIKAGMEDSTVLETIYTIRAENVPGIPEETDPDAPRVQTGITILSLPDITVYARGQAFDTAGLVVARVYSDQSTEPMNTGDYTVTEPDMTRFTPKLITVSAGGFQTSFTIQVLDTDQVLSSISVSGQYRMVQEFGLPFNRTGLVVTGHYSDGTTQNLTNYAAITGYDPYKRGPQDAGVRANGKSAPIPGITTRIGDNAELSVNAPKWRGLTNQEINAYRSVYIKGESIRPENCNIRLMVKPDGATGFIPLSYDNGRITREELAGISGYNPNQTGKQTLSFPLDGRTFTLDVIVIDTAPDVWFDYGYMRHDGDPEGTGRGAEISEGKYYAKPGETVILAPVRYLVGYNADYSDAGASYSWTVSGGTYTTSGGGEFLHFTPSSVGTYNISVSITGRSYVTGQNITKTASTKVVCFNDDPPGKAIQLILNNFGPGQMAKAGASGYGWSLGSAGGYRVWSVEHRASYKIEGNAFAGWHEFGIVWAQEDRNGNGLPDETWYELKGGDDSDPAWKDKITRRYALRYFNAAGGETVNEHGQTIQELYWTDSKGRSGYLPGAFPSDWGVTGDWVTYTLTLLRDTGNIDTGNYGGLTTNVPGYVDALGDTFFTSAAMDITGNPVTLKAVRFLRVQTSIFCYGGVFGDVSTEIKSADFLGKLTDFPDPN